MPSGAADRPPSLRHGVGSFDPEWRDIDSEYIETKFRHPNCIRASARSDLNDGPIQSKALFGAITR
jgi:hypothetical protein